MSVYLKVKLKSLAAEAQFIRKEENKRKVKYADRWHAEAANDDSLNILANANAKIRAACKERRAKRKANNWYPKSAEELHQLHLHRLLVVRKEARLTHIAYAIVRRRKVHDTCHGFKDADWDRIRVMVRKYGNDHLGRLAVAFLQAGGEVPESPTGISTPCAAGSTPASATV